jgi:two-component system sensor kinase
MVIYSATPDFIAARSSWRPWGLLLAGLVFTGLVAGFLVIVRHAEHAEKSAKDLSDLNANLAREIMERKRAEAVRKESQERLLTILNSMDACVYISDIKTYELLFVNNYVKDLFGDIVGQPCWKTLQAGQSGPCAFCTNDKLLDAAGNPEGICHWEFQNTVNGRWYDIHDRAIPWTDGRIVRMEIATDITERKRVEEKLQESYEDMESFSYSVSHDLRAPLRTIGGLSEILLKNYYDKLDDKGKSFLNLVLENIKRMDQLILALLNLSRVGRQQLKIVEIDMEKEAALIAGDLRAMAPERNITLDVGKLPPAHGDLALIRQVFTNLLSNAVKFTKERDVACIEVGGRCEGSENIYYVKDDGPGFDPELTDKLFKVFQRLHSAQEFEGIGIGLSIVHRIISRHDGRVWAEGRPDKGATFYFSLPKGKA